MPDAKTVILFGHTYRWVVADRGSAHPYRLSLLAAPHPEDLTQAHIPVPWTPSPCAEWNMRHIARKLAEGADPADA